MTVAKIEIPPKLIPVFSGNRRIRGAYGGRGSGKTFTFALMSAVRAYMHAESGRKGVILCAREWMNSLKDSSMSEVKGAIESVPWLRDYFDIGQEYIRTKNGRVEYIFTGLNRNLDSLKSKANILIAWVDEAEGVSELAYDKLEPTVRANGSEIWITYNPETKGSPTDKRFRHGELEGNGLVVEMNYSDNPWLPSVLDDLRKRQQRTMDSARYAWIWDGAYLENSDKQVFANKYRVDDFNVDHTYGEPLHGMDFGFAQDPTTCVQCYIKDNALYIYKDCGEVGLELDDTGGFISGHIPEAKSYVVRADSARPESISYLRRNGIPYIKGVDKWKGSVEDGVEFIKSFDEVIIHSECVGTIEEFRKYQYKTDSRTGDILPVILDAFNHYIDAIRYALAPMIRGGVFSYEDIL